MAVTVMMRRTVRERWNTVTFLLNEFEVLIAKTRTVNGGDGGLALDRRLRVLRNSVLIETARVDEEQQQVVTRRRETRARRA